MQLINNRNRNRNRNNKDNRNERIVLAHERASVRSSRRCVQTLEQALEHVQHLAVDVVVVDDVDQKVRVVDGLDDLARDRALFVDRRPLRGPQLERFVLPDREADRVDHSGLDDFLGRKHAPRDGIGRHLQGGTRVLETLPHRDTINSCGWCGAMWCNVVRCGVVVLGTTNEPRRTDDELL